MNTVILRHRRENLKKCSLRGLESRDDLSFYTYPIDTLPGLSNYLLLKVGAPQLTRADGNRGLFLIDGTWRLARVMETHLPFQMEARSLPHEFRTAYPRRQTECPDPESGLASIEALYISHAILGLSTEGLLDFYYWKEAFLAKNAALLELIAKKVPTPSAL
jgi:pre-rRNA-processing protein TSR3